MEIIIKIKEEEIEIINNQEEEIDNKEMIKIEIKIEIITTIIIIKKKDRRENQNITMILMK